MCLARAGRFVTAPKSLLMPMRALQLVAASRPIWTAA